MNDDQPTAPGRVVRCTACYRPYPTHSEACVMSMNFDAFLRREMAARAHFNSLTKLQRLLVLGIGARSKGAWFHYKGKVF